MPRPKIVITKQGRDYFGPGRHRGSWYHNLYRTALKDKEPVERQGPHFGNKQRARVLRQNPEGLEYPKGWFKWQPRTQAA